MENCTLALRKALGKLIDSPVFWQEIQWREVLLIKKHARYLSCELKLIGTRVVGRAKFGPLRFPSMATYNSHGLDKGVPLCFLDVCRESSLACPEFCVFLTNRGVSLTEKGWAILYEEKVSYEETHRSKLGRAPRTEEAFPDNVSKKTLDSLIPLTNSRRYWLLYMGRFKVAHEFPPRSNALKENIHT